MIAIDPCKNYVYFRLQFMIYLFVSLIILLSIGVKVYNFLDGRSLLLDRYYEYSLGRRSFSECESFFKQNDAKSDIVICLSTIPSRLPYLQTTLKSLLTQSRRPQKIRLHLPNFSKRESIGYEIPSWLLQSKSVEIIRCEDYGPATKLIPAVEDFAQNQKLLILDDDMIYPSGLVDHMYKASQSRGDMAIASSGWVVPDDLICHFVTLKHNLLQLPPMPYKCTRVKEHTRVDILQGYSSYLVKPSFFDLSELKDYSDAPDAANYVDDVWISAHCKAEKFVIPFSRFCFHSMKLKNHFKSTSLAAFNRGGERAEKRNNTVMIRYFKERWISDFS